jgi:hypothetical protein
MLLELFGSIFIGFIIVGVGVGVVTCCRVDQIRSGSDKFEWGKGCMPSQDVINSHVNKKSFRNVFSLPIEK